MFNSKRNGEILRRLRADRTQEEVAKALNVSVASIAMYEKGERTPRDDVKMALAEFYGKSVSEIFFENIGH